MAVRSNYIKDLMDSKNSLEKQYQEVIAESMKNIIGDNAKEEVRKLLKESEDEDSFEEEEVDDDTATIDNDEVEDDVDSIDDAEDSDNADDELWDDLEKCKSADGEYDCRGMDDDKLIKVLNSMGPEDGIRVMSNGDGSISVEVDGDKIEGTKEFVIDLDDFEVEGEDDEEVDDDLDGDLDDVNVEIEDEPEEDEDEVELELNEGNVDLGYMDHPGKGGYQKEPAFTLPKKDKSPTDRKKVGHEWNTQIDSADIDKGKDGNIQPYNNKVNEDVDECGGLMDETEIEIENDEPLNETEGSRPMQNRTGKTLAKDNEGDTQFPRSGSKNGARKKGTGKPVYAPMDESIEFKKKMNKLYEENKQMKSIVPQLQQKLMESMVINQSMGYIVRLLNENTTSVDEKRQISERFSKVNTLKEGKKLYETISQELKQVGKRNNMNGFINGQLAEGKQGKQSLVETTMYKSEKVNETLDFMKRLNAIK